ncbi:nuclear transport factor 2 family protein [Novosphingobium profundi]|uniref:nuclear transport factor 2 family protein n=1 Tax=Novosphingobium profundi TaxID=1774954 RepID=UPI001BD97143|nr:nuclear transport factor 2 family protein [Novosphingobium profundi]MBT0669720.1 nuclear transport factor 2 family protein [Novosphingobium profundi]
MSKLEIAKAMIAAYNAQDADLYVSYMTEDACEAGYRGAVVREGKEGTRTGLKDAFAKWPHNHAEIVSIEETDNFVVFREHVTRGEASDGSELVAPFDVLAVYSFEGDKCARVEFIR